MLALEGMMNLLRKCLRGSSASREAAYSLDAALAGNAGLETSLVTPLVVPLEALMGTTTVEGMALAGSTQGIQNFETDAQKGIQD